MTYYNEENYDGVCGECVQTRQVEQLSDLSYVESWIHEHTQIDAEVITVTVHCNGKSTATVTSTKIGS